MKKVLNNKKGFTLIELLAVIVILAILVMVAIPAVTRYLTESRKGTFSDNALTAIAAVRNDVILEGRQGKYVYYLHDINPLLEKKLLKSSFGHDFSKNSYILVDYDITGSTYSICLDDGNFVIPRTSETSVDKDDVVAVGSTIPNTSNKYKACEVLTGDEADLTKGGYKPVSSVPTDDE